MNKAQKIFVIVGPSGVGKDTLMNALIQRYPNSFRRAVTHTTRPIRQGEVEGENYYYVAKARFEEMIKNNELIEYLYYNSNYYGLSKAELESVSTKENKITYLNTNVKAVNTLHNKNILANYIGLLPRNIEVLSKRLNGRGTESQRDIEERLKLANEEIEQINESKLFSYKIVNDDLIRAINELESKLKQLYLSLEKA